MNSIVALRCVAFRHTEETRASAGFAELKWNRRTQISLLCLRQQQRSSGRSADHFIEQWPKIIVEEVMDWSIASTATTPFQGRLDSIPQFPCAWRCARSLKCKRGIQHSTGVHTPRNDLK